MEHRGGQGGALNSSKYQRAVPLGLSALAAFFVSFAEIAVRLAGNHETFCAQQIGLALSGNFAATGALAILSWLVLLPLPIFFRQGASRKGMGQAAFLLCGAIISGLLLTATDWAALGPYCSGLLKVAGIVVSAVGLSIVLERLSRSALIRRATVLALFVCAGGSVFAGISTWRHLASWTQDGHTDEHGSSGSNTENILVVVLDTLRYDRVGVYGSSKLTPNLDRLAADSIVYTHAVSTAPWTLPMHASLFTGLYPKEHNVSWGHYELDLGHPVIAELLKRREYSTFAISNNWLLNQENGFARGFDAFLETPNDPYMTRWRLFAQTALVKTVCREFDLPLRLGEDAGSAWTNWLMARRFKAEIERPGPFFGFINYFEAHDPYHPPSTYLEAHLNESQQQAYRQFRQRQDDLCAHACGRNDTFSPQQIELMAALYDAEVAYQDAMVGDLLATMTRLGLLENSWVIVTSDHGELFGESNMVFHTAGAHYQLLHVPLIVRPPGGTTAAVVATPVQPVDIFHKLAEIGGAELPAAVRQSYTLPLQDHDSSVRTLCVSETFGASITGLYVTQYRSMQTDVTRWLRWITSVYAGGYLLELDDRGPMTLYDVRTDPQMNNNLIEGRGDLVEEYLNRHKAWSLRGVPKDRHDATQEQ